MSDGWLAGQTRLLNQQELDEAIAAWGTAELELEFQEFAEISAHWDRVVAPMILAVEASTQLTAEDFSLFVGGE